MLNLLQDYVHRSLPEWQEGTDTLWETERKLRFFETNPNLRQKVEGRDFLPFYGNTAVFLLDKQTREAVKQLQEELYEKAGWMLAEKLDPDTFHMTLHDLVNSPRMDGALLARMAEAERGAKPLLEQWRGQPSLKMQTTWMFNMVNTSIVLGLAPAEEESRERLEEMYARLDRVVPLGHGLTPHITLAYYRPDVYTLYDVECMRRALRPVMLEITLDMENLVFQNFFHMNGYTIEDLPEQITGDL